MTDNEIDHHVIRAQFKNIIKSSFFIDSGSKIAFLEYIINETLQERGSYIKAYTIAIEGLGFAEDFDPQGDSRIRVMASRLRKSLSLYYQGEGAKDPVIIALPKRRYVPVFLKNPCVSSAPTGTYPSEEGIRIMVWPFSYCENTVSETSISHFIAEELSTRLGLFSHLKVIPYHTAQMHHKRGKNYMDVQNDLSARYIITGRIVKDQDTYSVFTSLTDVGTTTQLWSRRFDDILEFGSLSRLQETVIKEIIGVTGGLGGILIHSEIAKAKGEISPEYAMGMYTAVYHQVPNQGVFRQVESILIEALKLSSMDATLRAMLSEVYLTGFFLGFYDDPKVLVLAKDHLAIALMADSENDFACFMDSYWNLSHGLLDQAKAGAETLIQKNGDDIFFVTCCGYLYFMLGDYEKGIRMIEQAEKINPFLVRYNQLIYFQNHIMHGNYEEALLVAEKFYIPGFFWSPLLYAVALGLLLRVEEAKKAAGDLLRLRPDFQVNFKVYLRFIVLPEPILERFYQGLEVAGIAINSPSSAFHLSSLS